LATFRYTVEPGNTRLVLPPPPMSSSLDPFPFLHPFLCRQCQTGTHLVRRPIVCIGNTGISFSDPGSLIPLSISFLFFFCFLFSPHSIWRARTFFSLFSSSSFFLLLLEHQRQRRSSKQTCRFSSIINIIVMMGSHSSYFLFLGNNSSRG
jgi:hypothetical protein